MATLLAVTLVSTGEKYGLIRRVPTALWTVVLVFMLGVGHLFAARRYRD